jgi:phage pi2 protein 07
MQPEKWNLEKLMAMCAQEEDRINVSNGGIINYLKDNKKKNFNAGSSSKSQRKAPMQNQSQ